MKKTIFFTLMLVAVVIASCSSDEGKGHDSWNDGIPVTDEFDLTKEETTANKGLNSFAYDFFVEAAKDKNVADDKGNLSVSPLSATIALAMAANTFDNQVESSILTMLGQKDLDAMNSACNKLMRFLPSRKNGCKLTMANSVWYSDIYTVNPDWSKKLGEVYYSEVEDLDFSDSRSVSIINSWCSDKTNSFINNIIENISTQDVVKILNAMYFSGKWSAEFNPENTRKEKFYGKDAVSEVELMHQEGTFFYSRQDKFEMLELPFDGNTMLYLILPEASCDANELAVSLDYDRLYDYKQNRKAAMVTLGLPKFTIKESGNMTEVFGRLGLSLAGVPDKMGVAKQVGIGVIQKSSTSIDEKGATLAAVTIITDYGSNGEKEDLPKVAVTFNHPFIYIIKNNRTGTVLMAGIINNL